jgi:hypothetical protein
MAQEKMLDLGSSVHALVLQYPEVAEILAGLGFTDIVKPGMLNTAGRFMTIPKGAKMKGIDTDTIRQRFREKGYTLKEEER